MRLHEDRDAFMYAVGLAVERNKIRQSFLEKDYWVTVALKRLSESRFRDSVVFKGGTSLSKCFGIIERFSEDVDLAINNPRELTAGPKKRMLKSVERVVSCDLTPRPGNDGKSGSKRTTLYDFQQIIGQVGGGPTSEYLKIEITAYSLAHPSSLLPVESYLGQSLRENGRDDLVLDFGLEPFSVQVLSLERTFAEKVMALIKRSYSDDPIQNLQEKVRHVYDLQQILTKRPEMAEYLESDIFFDFLNFVIEDDRINRTSHPAWLEKPFGECCLFGDTMATWEKVAPAYFGPFRELLFGELPASEAVVQSLELIGGRLAAFDAHRG